MHIKGILAISVCVVSEENYHVYIWLLRQYLNANLLTKEIYQTNVYLEKTKL